MMSIKQNYLKDNLVTQMNNFDNHATHVMDRNKSQYSFENKSSILLMRII